MNILDIAKKVGTAIVRDAVPGGALLIDAVNQFLPEDKKLPDSATGTQVEAAANTLTADQRYLLALKELEVGEAIYKAQADTVQATYKAQADTVQAMLATDATSTHTTRPKIALRAFNCVAFCSVTVILMFAYAVLTGDEAMALAVKEGWPLIVAVELPFVGWLNNYFGILRDEQANKLNAMNGLPAVKGLLGQLTKK